VIDASKALKIKSKIVLSQKYYLILKAIIVKKVQYI
jgi:hypothetical protein